ncbi:MAG: glycosyltransferase family 2 protein [Oscillospiraceae bacterium]|nr:glycosyltransferase family 2 protein [Oscillospiraceae bacterium]
METVETVTLGVIACREEKALGPLLDSILAQTYPHRHMDVVLVDSLSDDGTRKIMEQFQAQWGGAFRRVTVLDNPGRTQSAGWNVVLGCYDSDVLIRVDAHALLSPDFVASSMACLNGGEWVCGGRRDTVAPGTTPWARTLRKAEDSLFGASIARFKRRGEGRGYVSSVPFPAYRREVTERVGRFNEALRRTEDNEYHYRVRRAGYPICFAPEIRSRYVMRGSLGALLAQKWQNGEWIGRTLLCCPRCLSWYHPVPGLFVAAIAATAIAAGAGLTAPLALLWAAYGCACLTMTLTAGIEKPTDLGLPVLFLLLHTAYGAGTLYGLAAGLLTMPKGGDRP